MSIHNLLEYSQIYSLTLQSLQNYYRNEIDCINDNASDGKSFKYKTKIVGKTTERSGNEGDANRSAVTTLNVEVTLALKHVSNFWRFLDLQMIIYETELDLL